MPMPGSGFVASSLRHERSREVGNASFDLRGTTRPLSLSAELVYLSIVLSPGLKALNIDAGKLGPHSSKLRAFSLRDV